MPARDWMADLPLNREKRPIPNLASAIAAFRLAPEWRGVLTYNEFALEVGAVNRPPFPSSWIDTGRWTQTEDLLTCEWLQKQGINVALETAGQAIQAVAGEHRFHPVRVYLDGLLHDGAQRIDRWLVDYLGVEDSEYARAVGAAWLIAAVARIYEPGCKADHILVLEGRQGCYKSTAFRTLGGEWFTDDLADLTSKDAPMQLAGAWIIEMSELDSLSRAEVGRVKAFVTRMTDRYRPPYGKRIVDQPRQCVFAGTVNHDAYLRDETGGRRFWPVKVGRINIETLRRDRAQLWAEAVRLYREGARWWLEDQDLVKAAAEEQAGRFLEDPWSEAVLDYTHGRAESDVAVTEILCHLMPPRDNRDGTSNLREWDQTSANRVARILTANGFSRHQVRIDGQRCWRYYRPEATPQAARRDR